MDEIWEELQVEETADASAIRRAYARRLKQVHPEDDPEGFQKLRSAYEMALEWVAFHAAWPDPEEEGAHKSVQVTAMPTGDTIRASGHQDDTTDSAIECDARRAADLIQEILSILESGEEQAALDRLQRVHESDDLQNIELKHEFEHLMVESLVQAPPNSYLFLEKVADLLNIETRYSLVHSGLTDQSLQLLSLIERKRAYARIVADAHYHQAFPPDKKRMLHIDDVSPQRMFAAQLRTGPFDPDLFVRIYRIPWKRKAVFATLDRLLAYSPGVIEHELNPAIVSWWLAKQDKEQKKYTLISSFTRPIVRYCLNALIFWIILVISLLVLDAGMSDEESGWDSAKMMVVGAPTIACLLAGWMETSMSRRLGDRASALWRKISIMMAKCDTGPIMLGGAVIGVLVFKLLMILDPLTSLLLMVVMLLFVILLLCHRALTKKIKNNRDY